MGTDFDRVLEIKGMNSYKWEHMKKIDSRAKETTLAFWLADMDFACADEILDAVKGRADKKILGYANYGSEYIETVRKWYKERFDWEIAPESLYYSPGLVTALSYLVNVLTAEGEGVIIQRPAYPPFTKVVGKSGRVVINSPLKNDNGYYTMDFEDLEEKCKSSKLFILCSPHNPVGRVWKREELERVVDICVRNGVTVIADEIHCDLTRAGVKHYNLSNLYDEKYKNMVITCTAPSKTFNIAGLSQSHIIINCPDIRKRWEEYTAALGICSPSPISLAASQAAFKHGGKWLSEAISYIDANLDFMESFIRTKMPGVGYVKPEGTYLTWLDFSRYGTSEEIYSLLLEKADIMLQRGTDFGKEEGEGYLRLNAACPRKLLEEGLNRISEVIKQM